MAQSNIKLNIEGVISADLIKTGHITVGEWFNVHVEAQQVGYTTRFSMSFRGSAEDKEKFKNYFHEDSGNTFGSYELNPLDSLDWDEMKWYDHNEDVLELSREWPGILIMLEGYGEEDGDIWKSYYKNGVLWHTKARIIFDEPPEGYFE